MNETSPSSPGPPWYSGSGVELYCLIARRVEVSSISHWRTSANQYERFFRNRRDFLHHFLHQKDAAVNGHLRTTLNNPSHDGNQSEHFESCAIEKIPQGIRAEHWWVPCQQSSEVFRSPTRQGHLHAMRSSSWWPPAVPDGARTTGSALGGPSLMR